MSQAIDFSPIEATQVEKYTSLRDIIGLSRFSVVLVGNTGMGKSTCVSALLNEIYHPLVAAKKSLKSIDKSLNEPLAPIDEKQLRAAIELVKKQKTNSSLKDSVISELVQQCFLHDINQPPPEPLTLLASMNMWEILARFQIRKVRQAVKVYLNTVRYLLAVIRRRLGTRLIDYLVSALHRAFYIPHSTLHMPNNSDEDSSTAYNRFEQITRAITGTHCLLLSS